MIAADFSPTVILVDELKDDTKTTKLWLETEGYQVREVAEIYDAFEEVTDMMGAQRAEMVLLHSYLSAQDCSWVINSLSEVTGEQNIPIVSFANVNDGEFSLDARTNLIEVENFDLLKVLVQRLLPIQRQTGATA